MSDALRRLHEHYDKLVRSNEFSLGYARERLLTANGYNAKHWQGEIDRLNRNLASLTETRDALAAVLKPNPLCGYSCNGVSVEGDKASIEKVSAALHYYDQQDTLRRAIIERAAIAASDAVRGLLK